MLKDGFGYRGVGLKPEPGKTLRVEVTRTIIAKLIGRIMGAGLFAESQKLGSELDWILPQNPIGVALTNVPARNGFPPPCSHRCCWIWSWLLVRGNSHVI